MHKRSALLSVILCYICTLAFAVWRWPDKYICIYLYAYMYLSCSGLLVLQWIKGEAWDAYTKVYAPHVLALTHALMSAAAARQAAHIY